MSINYNLISATLDDEVHAGIIAELQAIEAKLPWAVTLPAKEKASIAGVGIVNSDFINKCHEYAEKNPEFPPNYLNMEEFGKDVKLLKQLQVLMQHLVPLIGKLKDTHALVGAEAYSAARIFYHHMKNASQANTPGASAIAKELSKRYKMPSSNPDASSAKKKRTKTRSE